MAFITDAQKSTETIIADLAGVVPGEEQIKGDGNGSVRGRVEFGETIIRIQGIKKRGNPIRILSLEIHKMKDIQNTVCFCIREYGYCIQCDIVPAERCKDRF